MLTDTHMHGHTHTHIHTHTHTHRDEPVGSSILDHPSPRALDIHSNAQSYSSLEHFSQSRFPAASTSTGSLPTTPAGKLPPAKSSFTLVHVCSNAILPSLISYHHSDPISCMHEHTQTLYACGSVCSWLFICKCMWTEL